MSNIKTFLTFLLVNFQAISYAWEVSYDHNYIENLATNTVLASFSEKKSHQIKVVAAQLDPRIHIKACDKPLSANIPENHKSRNVNVKITCDGSIPWSLWVPTKVTVTKTVLVAKQAIDKGSILTENQLELVQLPEYKIRGEVLNSLSIAVGAKAKRNISKGKPIAKKQLCTVCKGDTVTLIASNSLLQIKTAGTSIENGFLGDSIKVKNNRSGKLVTGRVSGVNKVTIIL